MTVEPEVIAHDLLSAVPWIQRGWTQGVFYRRRGNKEECCLEGGITAGVFGRLPVSNWGLWNPCWLTDEQRDRVTAAMRAINDYLRAEDMLDPGGADKHEEPPVNNAIDWNDLRCKNGDEAVQLIEAVIARLATSC